MTDDQHGPVSESDSTPPGPTSPRKRRRRWVGRFFIVVGVVALVIVVVAGTVIFIKVSDSNKQKDQVAQEQAPFYALPAEIPAAPGSIIRFEPVNYSVVGGQGFRIVYTSQDGTGKPVAVSGLIFLPSTPAPAGGRKVLAWAHGTVGLASKCAPSRQTSPAGTGWLEPALQHGWVVASTDYLGLGVEGPNSFLVGQQEARDVVNSVRAAGMFQGSETGKDWIVWGASQGGNSALWTGTEAKKIAPELNLVAVGTAAPAAELTVIMGKQWNQIIGWVIGPEAYTSWSATYPDRDFSSLLTPEALKQNDALNQQCITGDGITGLVEEKSGNNFFKADPSTDPTWSQTVLEQTPRPLPASMPLFVAQGTDDKVVLEGSNALLQKQWCAAGVTMQMDWLGGVQHQNTQNAGGPAFIEWAFDRFAGKPAPKNCNFPPPSPTVAFAPATPTPPTPPTTPNASPAAKP